MGFKCGIVGLPNVGKSTLFNALTRSGVEAANYPFCTIEPNVGLVPVPDPRLDRIAAIIPSKNVIPAVMSFVDIAGLVAGAAKGEGLGNKFLANIRETQAIAHVVRCFENEDISHVSGKVDPIADIETINTELALADLESVDKALAKTTKELRRGEKAMKPYHDVLEQLKVALDAGASARSLQLDAESLERVRHLQLLTIKPVLYIANVDEAGLEGNEYVEQLRQYARAENAPLVIICAAIESEISQLEPEEQQEFLESLALEEPGLNRVIRAGYALLGLQTYFTVGPKEARAWTVPVGCPAPKAAAVIHNDFEQGFIRAEVTAYDDYMGCNGEQGAKEAGKWRVEGKDYIVQDGDVMLFRFNV